MRRRRSSIPLVVSLTITFCSVKYITASFQSIQKWGQLLQLTTSHQRTKSRLSLAQESIDTTKFNPYPCWFNTHGPHDKEISSVLICGDGDMSFSASIAKDCYNLGISMTVSVLEDEITHNRVYEASLTNSILIRECHHPLIFGVDATKLPTHFPTTLFDRIVFNFPHWKGKTNHKHNRALLDAFFSSAAHVLSSRGEIHVSLCQYQGGNHAKTVEEWKDSWAASLYAAEHGLLNVGIHKFYPKYNLSSFRGQDKGFYIGDHPDLYIFSKPNGIVSVPKPLRLCCRQELHVLLPDKNAQEPAALMLENIKWGNAILKIAESVVPEGISVELPARKIWFKEETGYPTDIAIFLIVYCGKSLPMKRSEANDYRSKVEAKVSEILTLRENRKDRFVSKPFPYTLLDYILKVHSSYGHMKNSYPFDEKEVEMSDV